MPGPDLYTLDFLAGTPRDMDHLKEVLYTPLMTLWGNFSREEFSRIFESLRVCLAGEKGILGLLELNLITAWLTLKQGTPPWFQEWLHERVPVERYLPGRGGEALSSGRWQIAPVFLVNGRRAFLRYFVTGLVSESVQGPGDHNPWPGWAGDLLDREARSAILSAVAASARIRPLEPGRGFYLFPLAIPNGRVQFTRGSLGLPLALAFLRLLTDSQAPEDLAATGSIDETGGIGKAEGLSLKIRQAGLAGFRGLLVPDHGHTRRGAGRIELLPVSNLREAWIFDTLYRAGRGKKLILMAEMLRDPGMIVNNCRSVPARWLRWAWKEGLISGVMDRVVKSPELFQALVEKVDVCLNRGDDSRAETLAEMIPAESVEGITPVAPRTLFKWYTLNLAMANHRGDLTAAEQCESEARQLTERAAPSDIRAFASFCNYRFIALFHNRYLFNPRLPDFLKDVLGSLKGEYRSRRRVLENATHETLGALYGSIAQNYGFCGPEYMDETRRYTLLAQEAFGDGKAQGLKDDWLRQFNYLVYAELDAGHGDTAREALLNYLEISAWHELPGKLSLLSVWQHAALARFLAGCGRREERAIYGKWAHKRLGTLTGTGHPWQLWFYNMGLVSLSLGEEKTAAECWRRGLDLCLSSGKGPTVRVMALLPLSGLWRVEALPLSGVPRTEEMIRRMAGELSPDHFRPFLEEPDLEKELEKVWTRPGDLFPFTYR